MCTLFATGRGERFFRTLSEGNPIAWGFLALAVLGWIIMAV